MLQAIQRQSVVYENKGIDMLKDGITLPSLAVLWLFVDNLCFFRCLAMRLDCLCDLGDTGELGKRRRRCVCKVQGVKNSRVLRLYEQFRRHTHQEVSFDNFGGVSYDDLSRAEKCFDLRVTVLALQPDGLCTVERRSERSSGTELFLISTDPMHR